MILFYLVFLVSDIEAICQFYEGILGCKIGCRAECWIDFDFFGYQLLVYLMDECLVDFMINLVDGKMVLVCYFGVIFDMEIWEKLVDWLWVVGIDFVIEFYICFKGEFGEQVMMFFFDFSGNVLEFKVFCDWVKIFVIS